MQAQNVSEYKAIREELTTLKNCITNYVGFVLAGSATAVWGLAGRSVDDKPGPLPIAFAAFLLAILSMFILFLLSYKFTSHNRYVGYCKLLMHEKFGPECAISGDLFYWEICLDRLRAADCGDINLKDYWKELKYHISNQEQLVERVASYLQPLNADSVKWREGWNLLRSSSRERSGSWKFPLYVARIFAAVNIMFIFFAAYFSFAAFKYAHLRWVAFSPTALLLLLVWLWKKFLSKLFDQMSGDETVEEFCWKFVPIRAKCLRQLDPNIGYGLTAVSTFQSGDPLNTQAQGTSHGRAMP